jgi:hypothetical protein
VRAQGGDHVLGQVDRLRRRAHPPTIAQAAVVRRETETATPQWSVASSIRPTKASRYAASAKFAGSHSSSASGAS